MAQKELDDLIKAGIDALGVSEPLKALALFEHAVEIEATPTVRSCLAYCMARERGQVKSGRHTCEELIKSDPGNPFHHLNLGRILLLEGDRRAAIDTFRAGIELEPHPHIIRELNLLGIRKPHLIGFLARKNPINRCLGRLCDKFLVRKLDRDGNPAENR
jgi:Flp pilus assembly protein TadD